MQQGKVEAKIIELARQTNQPLPDKIANKPVLRTGLHIYYRAFWECSTDRTVGMAEGPIPWTAINQWAIRYGFHHDEFDRLVLLLKAMDSAYIEERAKQHAKQTKKGKGKIGGGAIRTKSRN